MAKKKKKVTRTAKKKAVTKKAAGKKSVAAKAATVQVAFAPKELALIKTINHNLEVLACMILKQQPGNSDDTPKKTELENPQAEEPMDLHPLPVLVT